MRLFLRLATLGALACAATPTSAFAAGNHYGWCIGVGNPHDGECGTAHPPSVNPPTVSGAVPMSTQANPGYAIPPMPQATPMIQPHLAPQAIPVAAPQALPHLVPQRAPGFVAPHLAPQAVPHPTPVATPQRVPQIASQPRPGYAAPQAVPHPTPVATPQRVPQIASQPRPGYAAPQAVPHPTPVVAPSLAPVIARPRPVDTIQPDAARPSVVTLPPGTTPDRGLITDAPGRQSALAPAVFAPTGDGRGWRCVVSGHGRRRRIDATGAATDTGSLPGLVFSETIARDIPAWHPQDSGCLVAVQRKVRR